MPVRRADDRAYILAANVSATGNAVPIPGGEYSFFVEGTPNGATVALQVQAPSGSWATVSIFGGAAVSFATLPASQTGIDLPAGNVRLYVSGAPSGVYAYLVGLG